MKCKQCVTGEIVETPKTYTNGSKHIELRCGECNAFYGHKPQSVNDFVMPVGKYKGEKFIDVYAKDARYLEWMSEQDGKFAKRVQKLINSHMANSKNGDANVYM